MGTTLVLALIRGINLYIANVGDSRVYLYRNRSLRLLSSDHSVVAELMKQGEITKDEVRSHPQRNLVTQVIGINPFTECYQKKLELSGEDIIMLCSDGLWDMISDEEIKEIIVKNEKKPKNLCNDLIRAAKGAGGKDNITVIVIRIKGSALRKNK
jgi:protein phosphatase